MPSTSNAVRQLSDGNSQGTVLGRNSSDLIGFYGRTPTTRLGGGFAISTETVSSVIATSASGGDLMSTGGANNLTTWGFSSAAQGRAVVSGINALQADVAALRGLYERLRGHLVSTGIFTGS